MALCIWSSFFGHGRPRPGDLPRGAAKAVALRWSQPGRLVVSDHPAHGSGPSPAVLVQESGRPPARDRLDGAVARRGKSGTALRATRESAHLPGIDGQNEREAPDDVRAV